MLIHPGPSYSVADVHRGWQRAFAGLGCEVADINFDARLNALAAMHKNTDGEWKPAWTEAGVVHIANDTVLADAYKFLPDIVFIVSGFFVTPKTMDLMRERGTKVVLLHTEEPYELEADLKRAEHASLSLLNDPTNLEKFRAIGPAYYSPHAFDPDVHYRRPVLPQFQSDFAFVGTGYPSRIEFFEQVDWAGLNVVFGGNWEGLEDNSKLLRFVQHAREECLANDEAVLWYCGAKTTANLYRTELRGDTSTADGWAMGPREVECAALGAFMLRQARGEGDEVLPMYPTFDGPEDFEDKVRWYVGRDAERADIGIKAQAAVADRTFEQSAKKLLAHFA